MTRYLRHPIHYVLHLFATLLIFSAQASQPAKDDLQVLSVSTTAVPSVMVWDGEIEAIHQATVTAQTSGRVTELAFDVGDFVPQGAVIARITGVEQAAQLNAANARLKEAQALLGEAEQTRARSQSMLNKKLISQADFDKAEAAFKAAQARAKSSLANVTSAQERLSYTTITAPYSGIVVERLAQPGEAVNPGSPLISGVSLQDLRVVVHVPQRQIGPVRQNPQASVILPNGEALAASAIRIPPRAESNSHTFKVLLDLPKVEAPIFPGTLLKVQFVSGSKERLMVPNHALVKRGEVTAVYTLSQQDRLSLRYVRVGETVDRQTEILAGLSEGDRIAANTLLAAQIYKQQHATEEHAQ